MKSVNVQQVALHIPNSYNLSMNLPIVVGTVPYRRVPFLLTPTTRHLPTGCYGMQYLPVVVPPPYRENATPPPPVDGLLSSHCILTNFISGPLMFWSDPDCIADFTPTGFT